MWKVKRLDDKYTGQFENLFYELELHLEGTIPVDKEVSNKVARGHWYNTFENFKYIHRYTVYLWYWSFYKDANQSSLLVPIFGTTQGRMVLALS